jgi:predicted RND superfamily exporter protein
VGISLFEGLGLLLILFLFVAYAVSRSWHVSGAMLVCVALLPVALLGGIGVLHIPLDIMAAPATNVCIGMAVDAMIHLSASARRNAAGPIAWSDWSAACREQWRPTLISAVVVGTGFSIFALSEFPPSQRFGVTVAIGAVIAAALALVVLPLLASSGSQLRQAKSTLLSE